MHVLRSTGLVRKAYLMLYNFTVRRGQIIHTQDLSNNLFKNPFVIKNVIFLPSSF